MQRELYLGLPKEAKRPRKVWLLKKVGCGQSDALIVRYMSVSRELRKIGAVTSKYD